MAHLLTITLGKEQTQELLAMAPDKIVIKLSLEEAVLKDGSYAGVVKVTAFAMRDGDENPIGSVEGCPDPPCS